MVLQPSPQGAPDGSFAGGGQTARIRKSGVRAPGGGGLVLSALSDPEELPGPARGACVGQGRVATDHQKHDGKVFPA